MTENGKAIRLLLVDDEAEFREATVPVLSRRGYAVSEAAGGEEALAAVRRQRPDVVLLDLKMPGLDGLQTLRRLRSFAPDLPVILLTGHGQYEDALRGIRLDIVEFLQKPLDIAVLTARIEDLLVASPGLPLHEKTIQDLMTPPSRYPRILADQTTVQALQIMTHALIDEPAGGTEPRPRSILVYDRQERFLGVLRVSDMLRLLLPEQLESSPHSSYNPGMFLARCKVIGQRPVGELLGARVTVDLQAPLIQAVHLMSQYRLVNLPVLQDKQLVGIIREVDVILEMGSNVGAGG